MARSDTAFDFWLNHVSCPTAPNKIARAKKCWTPNSDGPKYVRDALTAYRHMVVHVNRQLDTTEPHLCEGTWRDIQFGKVPSKAMKTLRHAFANKIVKGKDKGEIRSSDPDRVECATNFAHHLELAVKDPSKAKIHGKNLQGGELVREYVNNMGKGEDPVIELQFQDIIRNLMESGELNGEVPVCDTSGSMGGGAYGYARDGSSLDPIYTAIFLTAVISKINIPAFRNKYLTFSTQPTWVSFSEDASLYKIVSMTYNNPNWQGSTNFQAAQDMILNALEENNVPKEFKVKMIVLSDMQFDSANGSQYDQAHYKIVQKKYASCGRECPRILYWDLSASVQNFVAPDDAPNVEVVSGYSHQLLKLFMGNELMRTSIPTPYDTMRLQLDSERYDLVRGIISGVGEGVLAGYVPGDTHHSSVVDEFTQKIPVAVHDSSEWESDCRIEADGQAMQDSVGCMAEVVKSLEMTIEQKSSSIQRMKDQLNDMRRERLIKMRKDELESQLQEMKDHEESLLQEIASYEQDKM